MFYFTGSQQLGPISPDAKMISLQTCQLLRPLPKEIDQATEVGFRADCLCLVGDSFVWVQHDWTDHCVCFCRTGEGWWSRGGFGSAAATPPTAFSVPVPLPLSGSLRWLVPPLQRVLSLCVPSLTFRWAPFMRGPSAIKQDGLWTEGYSTSCFTPSYDSCRSSPFLFKAGVQNAFWEVSYRGATLWAVLVNLYNAGM